MKVSVVIPVYNGHKYLHDAIDSVVNQTYRNVEIIVVNDGSNDDGKSREVAKRYGSKIRYIEQENRGVAGALNTGLSAMSGDVFCWLSHDDVYRPNKIERQVEYFNRLGRDDVVLFSNYALIDENDRITAAVAMERVIGDKPQLALLRGCINGCTIFVPKKIFDEVGPFNETLRFTQDYDLWSRMSLRHSFVHMSDVLVDYRMHPEQGSRDTGATGEANKLWIDLVDRTSLADRVAIAGSSLRFFQSQAEFLAATPYDLATDHAFKRAETCIGATKVSVIIPFFNEIGTARRAILSALAQTHQNLEVIAIDDGSTEDASELEVIAAADKRLRIIRKSNGGPASARNMGMRAATGEYVAFLDGDDTWAPEKIAVQMRQMQEGGYFFSHTSYHVVHPQRDLGPGIWHSGKLTGNIYPQIIGNCPIATPTVMLHRKLVEDGYIFPECIRIGEDCLLWLDIASKNPVLGIDIPMTTVELSDTSAAINLSRSIEGIRNIRDAVLASRLHSEHVSMTAQLTAAVAYLEKIQAGLRQQGELDVNIDLMMVAFNGSVAPDIGSNGKVDIPVSAMRKLVSLVTGLQARLHEGTTNVKRRTMARLKRVARSTLPQPIVEFMKAIVAHDYRSAAAISATWIRSDNARKPATLQDYFRLADQARATGMRLEFERACECLLKRFPENSEAWLGAAVRMTEAGRNDLALPILERAAALRDTALTQVYLGQVWRELGDYAKSESHYRAALLLDADEPQAHIGLAIILSAHDAYAESIQHIQRAANCGLDPNYSKFVLGGALVGAGRLDEANALFSQNISIPLPPPYRTDTSVLRFGNSYREVVTKIQTAHELEQSLHVPEGERAVVFMCCDGVYFERFVEAAVDTCIKNSGVDFVVHIHLVNRLSSAEVIIERLRTTISPSRLRITEETADLTAFDETGRRTYYACRRFCILPELIRTYRRPILCVDVDQLVVKPISALFEQMTGYDVGLMHDPLNALNLMSYFSATAVFVAPTGEALLFVEKVRRYIDFFMSVQRGLLWHLDQAALAVTYLNEPASVRLKRFPFSLVHSRLAGDDQLGNAVFWSITNSIEQNAQKLNRSSSGRDDNYSASSRS